ncbi:MAG: copper amine oxidase N-terminal domain-containing protein [Eubacterium sp.]|nr:copper amine oxidase N-terminal domain-containing protein [Eubacterium sp.]
MKKNLKKALCVLMSTGMLFSGVTVAYGEESNISLQINGSEISAEVPPTVIDGRTMVPVRAIFEAVGANIDFDAETKTITARKGDTTVNMTVGANAVTVNNKEVQLDAPAVIVNGRTLAPARFVAETFGYTVQWDAENKIVKITGEESSTETTTETTTVTTTETSTETTTESTTETTTKATGSATSSSAKYYEEYSDVLDYGVFSGANLVDKTIVELRDFNSCSYIYDFKYDKSKFSGLDKVVEAYAKQAEKNGWEITAMAEAEDAGILTLLCTKDDRILSFGTNFYDKKIMVEVIKSSKNTELLKKMMEESK